MKRFLSLTVVFFLMMGMLTSVYASTMNCWFSPDWKKNSQMTKAITKALSLESGITIKPRIARSYPEVLKSFDTPEQNLVYIGSFVQSIIKARGLGTALVQNINGEDLYSGVLVYPKDGDPEEILKNNPEQVAYTRGASSGESSAKAATAGKAKIGTSNHVTTCAAVKSGKAKAGFVKNWWWDSNKDKYPDLAMYKVPGVSEEKNPDNVLTASKAVPADVQAKISAAAIKVKDAFGAPVMVLFDQSRLDYPLELMRKGNIDPMTYSW